MLAGLTARRLGRSHSGQPGPASFAEADLRTLL